MTAPEIVRRLAAMDPICYCHTSDDGWSECKFCGEIQMSGTRRHLETCLWLLAKALDAGKEGT